uniref:Uncharacterized protein n=1 Tax=Trichuris muris TaxID=70415 RepID=A0A5S6Q173_TRIMR
MGESKKKDDRVGKSSLRFLKLEMNHGLWRKKIAKETPAHFDQNTSARSPWKHRRMLSTLCFIRFGKVFLPGQLRDAKYCNAVVSFVTSEASIK